MIKIQFTKEDIEILEHERFYYPNPKIQRRFEALYLKALQIPHAEICRICNIAKSTLIIFLNIYIEKGIDGLTELNYKGKPNELKESLGTLKEYFENNPVHSIAEAQSIIEELTGIKRGLTQVREFFKNTLNFSFRKMGHVPGESANEDKIKEQEVFKTEQLEPRLEDAKKGKRNVFFWMPRTLSTVHS